jgi:hypothetical protein
MVRCSPDSSAKRAMLAPPSTRLRTRESLQATDGLVFGIARAAHLSVTKGESAFALFKHGAGMRAQPGKRVFLLLLLTPATVAADS